MLKNTQNTTGADNAIICKLALILFNAKTKAMSALNPLAQKNNFNSRCLKSLSLPYAISLSSSLKKLYYSSTVLASAAPFNYC